MVVGGTLPESYSRNPERKEETNDMPITVNGPVIGLDGKPMEEIPGLDRQMYDFVKSNKENSDGLLNLAGVGTTTGGPVKATTPRPFIPPPAYPVMMYLPDHTHVQANTADEQQELEVQGYKIGPWSEKRQININSPETEKAALLEQNKMQATVIGLQDSKLQKMEEALKAMQDQVAKLAVDQSKKK